MCIPVDYPSDVYTYFVEGQWEKLLAKMVPRFHDVGLFSDFFRNFMFLGLRTLYSRRLDPEGDFIVFISKIGHRGHLCDVARYCTRHRLPDQLEVALKLGGRFTCEYDFGWEYDQISNAGEKVFEMYQTGSAERNLENAVRCLELLRNCDESFKLKPSTLLKILNREWVPRGTPEVLVQRMCVHLFPENPEVRILMTYEPKYVEWYTGPELSFWEDVKTSSGFSVKLKRS